MDLGEIQGEFIQVTGEFEKRDAIDFCVKDLIRKKIDFGVVEQDGKFFVARAIVDDEKLGAKSNIVTLRSDRVDITEIHAVLSVWEPTISSNGIPKANWSNPP